MPRFNSPLCPGSWAEPRFDDVRGGFVKCRFCPSWVPAPKTFDDDGFPTHEATYVPRHESPVTHAQVRTAYAVLLSEFRRAQREGTVHQPPAYRFHSLALDFALPGHTFAITEGE